MHIHKGQWAAVLDIFPRPEIILTAQEPDEDPGPTYFHEGAEKMIKKSVCIHRDTLQ